MPPRRVEPLGESVSIRVDRDEVQARVGEPLAIAIAASGRLVLGRSVKYHRPRGAACYSGRCDGCLMRVDGRPNVVTCREPVRAGMTATTQNVLGTAKADLLSATDWFFPDGMNHHEMFTQVKVANELMQKIARRVAGIGKLPNEPALARPIVDARCDVLVVGAGPAGMLFAAECRALELDVVVVDEEPAPGGHLRVRPGLVVSETGELGRASEVASRLFDRASGKGVRWLVDHTAAGVYDDFVLVDGREHATRFAAERVVAASGLHEGSVAIAGADKPGVMSVRAACTLLANGVLPGERVAVVGNDDSVLAVAARLSELGVQVLGPFAHSQVHAFRGAPELVSIEVERDGRMERLECDAAVVRGTSSGAFELGAQAGADVSWRDGFFIDASVHDGTTAHERIRAVGECAGVHDLPRMAKQARAAARGIAEELGRGR